MAQRRNSQVGFRDDTSYLAAHYGGGISRQAASVTAEKVSSSRGATSAHSTLDLTAKSIPSTSYTHTTPSLHTPKRSNVDAGRGRALQAGARRTGEAAALVRPTLSEQLASIGKAAEDITAGIRQSYGLKPLEGAIITTPSESFLVGKLRCKYPSPVHFFDHKCVYTFHHPFEATRITMEMFFRDMRRATLDLTRRQLRFKIDHALCHYGGDYSHDDPSHFVVILFSSGLDAARVAQEIIPLIRSAGGAR
ncbi:unnamed protein product [Pylaiella littoralis]